jgi:phosphoglycolate phosphatase
MATGEASEMPAPQRHGRSFAARNTIRILVTAPLSPIRGIVFDLDGTLVDSLADIADHLDAALADHGLPPPPRGEVGDWVGHGAENLIARAVPSLDLVASVLATFRARYRAAPVVKSRLYAGLADVLDRIAPDRRLAILSNKPHDLTVAVADALLRRWRFEPTLGARGDHPHKPDPRAVLPIAAELGVTPDACVLVGDSEVDIDTARDAGLISVAVTWGLRRRAVLEAARPDYLVDTPAALAALFGGATARA